MLTLILAYADVHNLGPESSWVWYVGTVSVDVLKTLNFNRHYYYRNES